MQLDETMLQSNTAINLVEYIDKIVGILGDEFMENNVKIARDYRSIKEKHDKALKRRSTKYRTDLT